MKRSYSGTLIRYFLFFLFTETALPSGIIEASFPGRLVFLSGTFAGSGTRMVTTLTGTITLPPITAGTDNDLRMATTTMI